MAFSGGRRRRCIADSEGLAYGDSKLTERAFRLGLIGVT